MGKIFKLALALFTISIVFSTSSISEAASKKISVFVDGKSLVMDQQPIIVNSRTLVPFRAILEALGTEVTWDPEKRVVKAVKGDAIISLKIDSAVTNVYGKEVILDVPAQIKNNRTLVPIRFVSESLGYQVSWTNRSTGAEIAIHSFGVLNIE